MTKRRFIVFLFIVSPIINTCAAPLESCKNFLYDKLLQTAVKVQERTEGHDRKSEEFRKNASITQKLANVCLSIAAIATCTDTISIFRSSQPPQEKFKQLLFSGLNLAYFKFLQTLSNHYINDNDKK